MKKFFAAAALSLAALLLFAGCSAQITADISSGWLTSPDNGYDPNFYESLDYSVDFVNSETDENLNIDIDSDNSAYNITTEAVGTMSFLMPDGSTATYTNVYHLTMAQTVSATYKGQRRNADVHVRRERRRRPGHVRTRGCGYRHAGSVVHLAQQYGDGHGCRAPRVQPDPQHTDFAHARRDDFRRERQQFVHLHV